MNTNSKGGIQATALEVITGDNVSALCVRKTGTAANATESDQQAIMAFKAVLTVTRL